MFLHPLAAERLVDDRRRSLRSAGTSGRPSAARRRSRRPRRGAQS